MKIKGNIYFNPIRSVGRPKYCKYGVRVGDPLEPSLVILHARGVKNKLPREHVVAWRILKPRAGTTMPPGM